MFDRGLLNYWNRNLPANLRDPFANYEYKRLGQVGVPGFLADKFDWVLKDEVNNGNVLSSGNPSAKSVPWVMTGQGMLGFSQFALETATHGPRPMYTGPKEWVATKINAGRLSTRLGLAGVAISIADGAFNKNSWQNHHTADVAIGLGLTGASLLASTATVAAFIPGLNVAIAVVGLTYFALDLGVQIFSEDHKSINQKLFD
jgi:hypothetical protein